MGGPHIIDGRLIGVHGLVQDIDGKKRASDRLQAEIEEREKSQQRQQLLIHELNHRVKNILAMVQAMAAQTLSTAATPQAARVSLEARLIALAQAHDVLTRESWDGAELMDIVTGAVAAHERRPASRFRIDGPHVRLAPKTAVSLAMALHELTTNAVKYGALSNDAGWVTIDWTVQPVAAGVDLCLSWTEQGGPPVAPPQRKGFGTRLIARSLASESGVAELSYPPEGARCRITVVLPAA
jgi:two-component sensor histidine kinase